MPYPDGPRRRRIADGGEPERCDFCRSPIPGAVKTMEYRGSEYTFCTDACREAMGDQEQVFTEYRGHRWLRPGVATLRSTLPQGIPRNSAVLLSGQPGTRQSEFHAEIAWRTLGRGEPAVFVTFQEPPIAVVERFLTLDWNVLPYLESGDFHILDCFTYRVDDRDRMLDRMNDWNRFIHGVAEPEVTAVRDPTNISEIENRLDGCVDAKGMVDTGVVLIDSLTEFGSLVQPVRAYDYVKDVRADIAKGRFVPIFAAATYTGDSDQFPHDLEYMFDGIVDMEHNPQIVEDALIKRMRVRKMNGALSYPEWTAYEFTAGEGLVMFDPADQAGGDGEDDEPDGGGEGDGSGEEEEPGADGGEEDGPGEDRSDGGDADAPGAGADGDEPAGSPGSGG